jgi:hypothetical protein
LIDGSPENKRKMLTETSLDILEDRTNQVHQFHHRVQLSHYNKPPEIPLRDGYLKVTSPDLFSWELPVLSLE